MPNPTVSYPSRLKYSPSRGGHAPGHLRDALADALEGWRFDGGNWWEQLNLHFFDSKRRIWWENADPKIRGRWLLGQLWNCTDFLPQALRELAKNLGITNPSTYAQLARQLKYDLD